MPNSPKPLLGRDLLEKLEAEIKFTKGGDIKVIIPDTKYVEAAAFFIQEKHGEIPAEVENAVIPLVWASEYPGKSKQAEPVSIALRPGAAPVRQKQYPLKLESRKGLAPIIEKFLKFGLLVECESRFNTPILPVRKADGKSYRLVQDLRAINRITEDIYPVVANPYTLLTTLTEDLGWFTVLDLKDAFFCIPVHKDSQEIFAFEWENPETGRKTQLTWRVLPQGFKNSPTLFGNQLAKELEDWRRQQQEGVVLQYVDDILIAAKNRDQCIELTVSLLNFLGLSGYRVSREKAQIAKEIVIYLGLEIYRGHRRLSTDRKEAICRLPEPHTVREMQAFLGMVGWCRLWIANYGLLVKPLYEALKTAKEGVITWTDETREVFKQLKQSLMSAPALGLPDLTKPFELFTHEQLNVALGVLSQTLGSQRRAVAYFSKQLDSVSQGWPGCLRAVAATVILIEEARKLTLGQHITVYVPHAVQAVLEQKGGHWLSPSRMLKYQVVLLEQDDVTLKTTSIVNPAMFLSSALTDSVPEHDCLQTIEETYSSRPDLKDEPLENADWELYTDGSSFMRDGKCFTGYAVTTRDEVIEAKALSADVSSQKAELIALTRALELSEGKKVNIWTDSKYAFSVVHAHGAIWKERGLLTAQGSGVKHADQIHALLQSIWKPEEVAIMHCRAHQKGKTIPELGNQFADQAAKRAAEKGILAVVPQKEIDLTKYTPKYDERDNQLIKSLKAEIKEGGWAVTPTGQVVVPPPLLREIAQQEHEATHWGTENLLKHLKKTVIGTNMTEAVQSTVGKCEICKRNNPDTSKRVVLGVTKAGDQPGDYWQIDFAELPPWGGYKYILVLVDTFSGWPEAYPCRTNAAREVVKALLNHIIPRFGVPLGMASDRGTHFIATVVKEVCRILGIVWDLHTPYRPQASGKVERMNGTLKMQISKICQETSMSWVQALPLALLRIRIQPRRRDNISPYEILYGRPYQAPHVPGDVHLRGRADLQKYLIALGSTLQKLQKVIELSRPIGLDTPAHPFQPGDWVYVKWWNSDPLRARWRGPYQVLLTSLTSVKVAGREPWFHYSRVKKASAPGTTNQTEPDTDDEDVE
ncbi:protein NYNRIN-like [Manacus vitellinus]|uniref:protein NYNRIN-like n=1 Tax=Manacus vitellinus TaxID=328815 RepID=UPI00115DAD15|nr:protein NYNRIN-like [Manacus vitellinus]